MREIKFRAKRKDTGDWLYWNVLDGFSSPRDVIDESTVSQNTGVKDKNGKDVYEGDVLESDWDGYLSVVKYETRYGASWNFGDADKDGQKRWSYPGPDDKTVIGNIYENPELMQK